MIPIPLAGIAVAGSALLAKYTATQRSNRPTGILPPIALPLQINLPAPLKALAEANPLQSMLGGLTSKVSQITKSFAGEDYNKIVMGFLPPDSTLIKPRHLSNSGELGLADLDGDSQDELLASYRSKSGVGTIVLKKENGQWYKLAELNNPGYSSIHFRDTTALTGSGNQQLLLSFPSEDKRVTLHAYSLENGIFKKLFEQKCTRFELLGGQKNEANQYSQEQLAFWEKDNAGSYKVDLVRWNGLQLEQVKNKEKYYKRKVIPYHAKLVKRNPQSPLGWYNLAGALAEAGYSEDALAAVDVGMDIDKTNAYENNFLELKKRLE